MVLEKYFNTCICCVIEEDLLDMGPQEGPRPESPLSTTLRNVTCRNPTKEEREREEERLEVTIQPRLQELGHSREGG